jgi:diguanylate cyclase (GGDEF)-like protein/PAS domain S-box-containing protein
MTRPASDRLLSAAPDRVGDPAGALQFEALFQQAPCGYLITGDDGIITAVNDTFLLWSGYARDTVLGMNLSRLMPVGDRILYSTHLAPQLRIGGTIAEALIEIVAADGGRRAALLSAARTPASTTDPAQIRVIIFSAAERRRYEQELVQALRRAHESEARRLDAEAGLQHLAAHDPLTGLPNRLGLSAYLDEALATRPGANLAVLSIDLDHFKAVNDSLGHAAGDELLMVVAQRLQACIRTTGTVARVSGDEFVIVDQLDVHQAGALGQRVLQTLTAPVVIEGLEVIISASVGAAIADVDDDTAEALLRRADIAMYRAKAQGLNSFQIHDRSHADPEVRRLHLLGELRAAISAGELRLHYQPRVELSSARFHGVEALVRWQHPTRGLLPPSEFIDVAEESGLIRELGAWVLHEAVAQAAQWNRTGVTDVTANMAVNLSTRQLSQADIVQTVRSALSTNGIEPAQLTLEITETALMSDPAAALVTLTQLKALGVKIAIDDFGTGYGSLTYLQQFPIDELKIDRSFVTGLGTDNDNENCAIVAACVQLAHAVGIHALAEGVETHAQRRALIGLGCDLAQGYLFARPLTADDLTDWLDTSVHDGL